MKNKIKELRVKIDGLAQLTKELKPIKANFTPRITREGLSLTFEHNELFDGKAPAISSSQIEKAVDSLYLAKAWLGKVLGELGTETPYKNDGKRKSVEDIEPTETTADQSWYKKEELNHDMNFDLFKEKNHIEKVDWLRQEIEVIVNEIKHLDSKTFFEDKRPTREFSIARTNAYNYLCEARFWLGFELERIKKNG